MALDFITGAEELIKTIVDKVAPDANLETQGKITQALQEMNNAYALQLEQVKTNNTEAQHPSIFVAGARPAAMWVGVVSLFYAGIGVSLFSWIASCFGLPPLPMIDSGVSSDILMGLLGLGGMRTFEKYKGVQTTSLRGR